MKYCNTAQYGQASFDLDCQGVVGWVSLRLYSLAKEQYCLNVTDLKIKHFLCKMYLSDENNHSLTAVLQAVPAQFLVLCACVLGFYHVEATPDTLSSLDSSFCQ